jgi:hypothetical protein
MLEPLDEPRVEFTARVPLPAVSELSVGASGAVAGAVVVKTRSTQGMVEPVAAPQGPLNAALEPASVPLIVKGPIVVDGYVPP